MPKSKFLFTIIFAITAGVLIAVIVMAWTNPTANPPSGNGAISYFNGNVGIGTAAPGAKLELFSNIGTEVGLLIHQTGVRMWDIKLKPSDGKLYFTDRSAVADRMTIDTSGNVGIGTASPGYKLDVVGGSMRADGYVAGGQLCMGYASPDCRASWSAVGGSGFTGGGTTNYVPKWTSGTSLSNSTIFDDGTTVTMNSYNVRGATYSFGGMYVWNGICHTPNYYTGGCSCPTDFIAIRTAGVVDDDNWGVQSNLYWCGK